MVRWVTSGAAAVVTGLGITHARSQTLALTDEHSTLSVQATLPSDTVAINTGCPYPVTSDDYDAGIQLVGDTMCVTGGRGCFQNVCRFCQFRSTKQSRHMITCAEIGYPQFGTPVYDPNATLDSDCPYIVPTGDAAVGISLVGDATCAHDGGLGCFENVCRYCKVQDTPQSNHLLRCVDLKAAQASVPTWKPDSIKPPVIATAKTAAPSTTKPSTTKPVPLAPVPIGTVNKATGCATLASSGDIAVGIQLVGDKTCAGGGIGCFQKFCRYCRFSASRESTQFVTCTSLGYNFGSVLPVPTAGPMPTQVPTESPKLASAITADPVSPTTCPYIVSDSDFAVGIRLVSDASCASGGLGCFKAVCRYCKFKETPESTHWVTCADYVASPAVAATVAPQPTTTTIAPVSTHAPVAPTADLNPASSDVYSNTVSPMVDTIPPRAIDVTQAGCDGAVAIKDVLDGIDIVLDRSCLSDDTGCVRNTACRYCMRWPTEGSAGLVLCDDIQRPTVAIKLASVNTSAEDPLDELLKNKTFKWSLTIAACCGVVAAVALIVVGAKSALAHRSAKLALEESRVGTVTPLAIPIKGSMSPIVGRDVAEENNV